MTNQTNESATRTKRIAGAAATIGTAAAGGAALGLMAEELLDGDTPEADVAEAPAARVPRDPFDDVVPAPAAAAVVEAPEAPAVADAPTVEPTAMPPATEQPTPPAAPAAVAEAPHAPVAPVDVEPAPVVASAPPAAPPAEQPAEAPADPADPVMVIDPVLDPSLDPAATDGEQPTDQPMEQPAEEPAGQVTPIDPLTGLPEGQTPTPASEMPVEDKGGAGATGPLGVPGDPTPVDNGMPGATGPLGVPGDPITGSDPTMPDAGEGTDLFFDGPFEGIEPPAADPPAATPTPTGGSDAVTPVPLIEIEVFDGPAPSIYDTLNQAWALVDARVAAFGSLSMQDIDNDDKIELWRALKQLNPTLTGGPLQLQGANFNDWTLGEGADKFGGDLRQLAGMVHLESNENLTIADFAQHMGVSPVTIEPQVISVEINGQIVRFDSNGSVAIANGPEGQFQTIELDIDEIHDPTPGYSYGWLYYIDDYEGAYDD